MASKSIFALALGAALTLTLGACGTSDKAGQSLEGEPIEAIAPPDGVSWNDVATISADDGYVVGNPEAPLKLVEYASHTCSHCGEFSATGAKALHEKYIPTGVVSYEIRELIRDPIDLTIAALVRCGRPEQMHPLSDQAWAALGQIFDTVNSNSAAFEAASRLPPNQRFVRIGELSGLIDFFAARGLPESAARQCLADSARIEAIARKSQELAARDEVNATPTFFLNGQRLNVGTWSALEPILQQSGARAR